MNAVVKIVDLDDPGFDPTEAEKHAFGDHPDPYPLLRELHDRGPVNEVNYRVLLGAQPDITQPDVRHFAVTGYEEVGYVLSKPLLFSQQPYVNAILKSFGLTINAMDPPLHTRYRKVFQQAFLPHIVKQWSDQLVDPTVTALVKDMVSKPHADLVPEFTKLYPFQIIYKQLELPPEDIKTFFRLAVTQNVNMSHPAPAQEAGEKLGAYFEYLLNERRRKPGRDLISLLLEAEVDGDKIPQEVLIPFLRQIINAAGDTTFRATSVMLTCLLRDPPQLEAIRKDRSLILQAIEETLRWDGPVLNQNRMATQDLELGGVFIPAGAIVDTLAGVANRDPSRFPDPDHFDIFRERKYRHYSFSGGPHVCIGQHLARLEMTRALTAMLERIPAIRLDPDMPPPDIRGVMMRVPQHIYVRFD